MYVFILALIIRFANLIFCVPY